MRKYQSFQKAFVSNIKQIVSAPEFVGSSRIGNVSETTSLSYTVTDPSTFKYPEALGRIDYNYADTFYKWLRSGSTDVKTLVDEYPNVAQFLAKPKSKELPDNFNTFYGPRIAHQLPKVLKELRKNSDSRRGVIQILAAEDLELLDKDEKLEFPCTDSITYFIRENKLFCHVHMRSQNMSQVVKLDHYVFGRLQCEIAEELGIELGHWSSSIVSAHVFDRDLDYLKSLGILQPKPVDKQEAINDKIFVHRAIVGRLDVTKTRIEVSFELEDTSYAVFSNDLASIRPKFVKLVDSLLP